jgi:hypothetical protein
VGAGDVVRFARMISYHLEAKTFRVRRAQFVSARETEEIVRLYHDEVDGYTRSVVADSDPHKQEREVLSGKGTSVGKDDLVAATGLSIYWGIVFAARTSSLPRASFRCSARQSPSRATSSVRSSSSA